MSDSEDITSYSNEDNNITHEDQLEFSSLHASLISDVEGEDIAIEFNSAPSSPSSLALRDISPLRTASAPSSPSRSGSSVLPRTSSVKALVNQFENNPSIMAANAKKEAAEDIRKIGHCKGWVTRYFNKLETLLVSSNDVLDPIEFKNVSEQIEAQCDKIITYRNSVDDIYANHSAEAAFKSVYDDIELYLTNSNQRVNAYAQKVARGAGVVAPVNENISKAELLKAMSQLGNEHIKINVDTPNVLGDEKDK